MKRTLLAAALVLSSAAPGSAATLELLAPYLSGQYFTWQERVSGARILKESGTLFSAGVVEGAVTDFGMTIRGKGELFGGEVGYDGQTQDATPLPVSTDVVYLGTVQQLDLGYRAGTGGLSFEPFAGAGYRWWLRDLQDTRAATGEPVYGYTELWQTAYARIGARGRYVTPSASVFAEGGGKYPFFAGNRVDFDGYGDTMFRPGGRWSAFGDAGVQWRRLKLTLSYEGFRFSHSAFKTVGTRLYFQPDSSSDLFGLSAAWSFK